MDRLLTLVVFIQTHGIPFVSWCQVRAILPCVLSVNRFEIIIDVVFAREEASRDPGLSA
mgnify:CR=1 FL=1